MAISRDVFESGMTIDQFKAQMRQNRENLEQNEEAVVIPPDERAFFAGLSAPLNVLTLAEDWCPDVVAGLAVVGKLARETGKLNVRVLLRDEHLDIADQYLKDGKYRSVPVFVLFDQAMRQLGVFIERPARATTEMREAREQYIAAHPENAELSLPSDQQSEETRAQLLKVGRDVRAERVNTFARYLIEDLHALLEVVPA